ncbi:MAG TPA: hypothetical protein VFK69_04725 [Candidatus Eisenbacteria bacterium]|nr:hypothetical protein [Candidatus Eisenbacteria bacterium]
MRRALVIILLLCIAPAAALAGNNAGATAYLTWDRDLAISNLAIVPPHRFPLYLRIQGASDIKELAVNLQWSPQDIVGQCFYVVPDSSVTQSCGWNSNHPPDGTFAGDSTYTWSIGFPPGSDKTCVVFWVWGDICSDRPATFCLSSLRTIDSNGNVDDILVTQNATLADGEVACPEPIQLMYPRLLPTDQPVDVVIMGQGLNDVTWASLAHGSQLISASNLSVKSETQLTATFLIPPPLAGTLNLTLGGPSGPTHFLANAASASDTFAVLTVESHLVGTCACTIGSISHADCSDNDCVGVLLCPSVLAYHQTCGEPAPTYVYDCHVQVYVGGVPAVGLPMRVDYSPVLDTGGHCHNDDGRPAVYNSQTEALMPSASGVTDSQGLFSYGFMTPEVAGQIEATVYSTDAAETYNPGHYPTATFCIRVAETLVDATLDTGLVAEWFATPGYGHPHPFFIDERLLPALKTFLHGRDLFLQPADPILPEIRWPLPKPLDPSSDNIPEITEAIIDDAAQKFHDAMNPNPGPIGAGWWLTLRSCRISNISLPNGGLLDEKEHWLEPLCWHRYGDSVDFKPPNAAALQVFYWYLRSDAQFPTTGAFQRPQALFAHHAANGPDVIHVEW